MKFWQIIVLILIITTIGVGVSIWQPWKTSSRHIEVSAEGKVQAVPDVSKITAGVEVKKSTADEAQKEASTKMAKIVEAVKAKNIAEKDIQTDQVSTTPNYDYLSGSQEITDYYGRSTVTITVRQMDKAQEIVDVVTANGASSVYGPQLTFSDEKLSEAQTKAREDAVKEAKSKAEALAKTSGAEIGKVLSINESPSSSERFYPLFAAESAGDLKASAPVTSIEPGENDITITVTVSYALK